MTLKISDMTGAGALVGTEAMELVQGGNTRKTTVDAISLKSKTLAELNTQVSDATIARTDAAQTFTGLQEFGSIALGGNTVSDILISSDGASVSDAAVVTAGWIDANVGGSASDHGALTGLSDDDHSQYLLANGTRAITGAQEVSNGTEALPGLRFSVANAGFSYNVAGRLHITVGGASQQEVATTWTKFAGSLLTRTSGGYDLGGTVNTWRKLYIADILATGVLEHTGSTAGFYGATPVAQQTGVAVTASAIHAALVNLGLITA